MQYFLGSIVTLLIIYFYSAMARKKIDLNVKSNTMYSQSYMHRVLRPLIPNNNELNRMYPIKTQSRLHKKKTYLRILFMDNKAYWIKDSVFYFAEMQDGRIIEETTQKVDIMNMDRVELDKMSFIVEKLTEGFGNDNSNPGL